MRHASTSGSQQVFLGDSYPYQITFDMVDLGGAADRDFRIGHSVVAFPVWAFGSPEADGSSVSVVLPATFTPAVYGGPLIAATDADGTVRLTADVSNSPSWFAYVTAERPGIFTDHPLYGARLATERERHRQCLGRRPGGASGPRS